MTELLAFMALAFVLATGLAGIGGVVLFWGGAGALVLVLAGLVAGIEIVAAKLIAAAGRLVGLYRDLRRDLGRLAS